MLFAFASGRFLVVALTVIGIAAGGGRPTVARDDFYGDDQDQDYDDSRDDCLLRMSRDGEGYVARAAAQ